MLDYLYSICQICYDESIKTGVSSERIFMKTTNTDEPLDAKLSKLQERERKLRTEALQLRARAEHLNRVRLTHAKRLARRIDAHEKIVLGALVKKAGLDKYVLPDKVVSANQKNDNVMTP